MTIKLDIVTAEKVVLSREVDIILAPGLEGELGILSHHAPLMTVLAPGELVTRTAGEEYNMAISGGFMEVRPERVIILADSAERAEDIDIARAEAAKERARKQLDHPASPGEASQAEAALRRALARIEVANRVRKKKLLQNR